ncbi:lysine-sensitive aspartokinase 3 [Ferrimonas balearica]|uniref:lysine-sensitive aspartokinase 3 n=1 Tax=Ferrimonas balearica TaxID=44012 RepID=UPI001F3F5AAE|nr:lysine-sensitive aspartokinase 3 [Ferrimonas balearica]MBY6018835.1 lysine-sensitive aspartokinase 3 [Halomonas denitrificans]MBY6096025.1 lysine-sensitive aspartokinase 3 [Ferrimonas balearica]
MNTHTFSPVSLTVAKFGGTSVADYAAMDRCADIILADPSVRVVVVSASSGVTNLLVELSAGVAENEKRLALLGRIAAIQYQILDALGRPAEVAATLDQLLTEMDKHSASLAHLPGDLPRVDALLALGEQCSSLLFAELLRQRGEPARSRDVREVMRTDSHHGRATPQLQELAQLAQGRWAVGLSAERIVTQGFIGADGDGNTTTLGRGGSDFSAALLAEALGADNLAIWTDVDGIYSCDPRLVSGARPIPELSFDEAAEMATFGAKVLHPATILPAVRSGCAVFVGCSRSPELGGTWIRNQTELNPVYRAVSLRRNQTLLTVHSLNMLHAQGFLAELFAILARHRISVDLITTSEVSVALTLDSTGSDSGGRELLTPALLEELGQMCRVEVETGLALVAVIGNRIATTAGVGKRVFEVLENHNVRMICQGASAHNLCFLVDGNEVDPVVQELHGRLLEQA